MPHQKSTVLSVCLIYRRSAYLEAIVIQHCRLFTYFSGIVPSYRVRKWVNWYADCLSLKPFQNQLCHWFSVGACIPFLNVMRCSAWVRWGACANLTRDQSWFSYWQDFHGIQWKFSPGPGLQAEFLCLHCLLFANHVGYMWSYRCLCLSLLSSSTRWVVFCLCVHLLRRLQKFFLATLEELGPTFPAHGTSPAATSTARASICLAADGTEPSSSSENIPSSHTPVAECIAFFFFFTIEFELPARNSASKNKGHLPFQSIIFTQLFSVSSGGFLAVRIQVSQALSAEPGFTHPQKLF